MSAVKTMRESMPAPGADRRSLLKGAALFGAGAAMMQPRDVFSMAQQAEDKIEVQAVSEHARPVSLNPKERARPRWIPQNTGNYNLADPDDNYYAFAKAQVNLAGEYTWNAQYGWIVLAPPGVPSYPFLGRVQLMQYFATEIDPELVPEASPGEYMLWGTFLTTHVDPRTMEPIDRIMNPYTGKMIDLPTIRYADKLAFRKNKSIIVPGVDPAFYDQPWDRDGGYSQHFIDADDEITYTVLGSSQLDGPQQPRVDIGFWSVKRDELMNPSLRSIDTRRDYSAVMKASEYAWYGIPKGDQAQLAIHLTGTKTQNLARVPDFVRKLTLDRFPEHFDF